MSGKGASVGAPRAGGPGAPRVLVYVADPRQLEPAAVAPEPPPAAPPPSHADALYLSDGLHQLPRNTLYRHPLDCPDQRNHSNTVFYKAINDNDGKLSVFGAPDNLGNRSEYLPVPQQFLKDPNLKADEVKVNDHSSNSNAKSACGNSVNTDLSAVETFTSRLEVGDLATYQRCSGPIGPEGGIPPMHPVALQSGVECSNSSDRELSRSYVNYQFLEQSVSHQSIVNQSISILNQQVGVSRGIVSEGESANGAQLVRTADGVVLAVLPSPAVTQATDGKEHSLRTTLGENPQTIVVPLGWRRIINGSSVVYISPSGTALSALPQLRDYLQTAGTCKCGLPCPLRPETAFNFDPKVVSKPYQASSGAELTKLCNHKRKLLATLQARAHSPATPPPQHIEQKKVTSEVTTVKKKMKKRPGFPPNMTVSQLMVQRDRPLNEFKPQDVDHNRTVSPGVATRPPGAPGPPGLPGPPGPPAYVAQQNILSVQDNDAKQDTHVQRSSHYLTVNSGWITQQQENLDGQKSNRPPSNSPNQHLGLPVLGTNGQLIGVNTSYKQNANYKSVMGMPQNVLEQDTKDEKKDVSMQHNIQPMKHSVKEEESQIYCGLNQPLTPEVMQKINEQQQIFIQQNQKQIEMAMKGYRTQLAENVNLNKSQNQGQQYVPQGQLVIQNGAVVKTNPAKTPPWQVKRNDSNTSNPMASPNLKPQKSENADYDEPNANISEDAMNSYNSFQSNEHAMNQAMCSRVPPLPQHYNMLNQQWPSMEVKKKGKNTSKAARKKASAVENKVVTYGSNGMRIMPDSKHEMPNNNVPSFMDDPSGYLAQQTVLLNNTISRQVGMNSSYDANQYEVPNNCYSLQNQTDKTCKPSNKQPCEVANSYRSNMVPNPLPSPNTTPDSSVLSDKGMDNSVPQCCKGCNISMKSNGPDFAENQLRLKYMKQNAYKMELDGRPAISSPNHGFDDNPVTSSTFLDRSPMLSDNCGPIQAGTVSTSNVSPTETLQPPEPSPTLSNSSRSTDTPHSSGGNGSQMQPNCSYPMPSPMYSNQIACKENYNSNPSTPGHLYPYNSPGPPNNQCIGTQMMHFISNHNVNKNLMEVDNISMVGVKPGLKPPQEAYRAEMKRRMENSMPGYCPPPHLGGGPAHSLIQTCYVQTFVTTMASGFSVTRDTVTSVLAGKTSTATTSINASQLNFVRPPPPPSVNLATTYAIPNNQPDPFLNSVNLPTSYPLHIAGTTAQNMISKSPLEMVQNVIGSLPSKSDSNNTHTSTLSQVARRPGHTTPGQILISSTGQIIVSNSQMPPPPPKTSNVASPMQGSSSVTNVTTSVAQVMPGVQPIVNQPTVVVNTLPTPFVIQPSMMSVDGQVVQQNAVLPQIVTAGIVSGQSPNGSPRQMDVKNGQSFVQGVAMLSPESLKKRKKKKNQPANITNVLQIAAPQQNPNSLMVHHSSPQHSTSPQFSPRGFQLSPNNNISPTPMLQALTIVPGKSGSPAHIVMNGQGNANNFGSQQIITNTSPSQQINLLQPVNLINNASSVMSNFPAFQQFIVPNLGGMVMTADGTAIIQDNSTGMPMQLQLQTVNGQNVLTPVQNPGMFATGANGGVVIRAQNQQGKMIQSQHSPGAQFLSPNSQVMMNSPNFNGQLSPLLANLSPTSVAFNANPQVRSGNVQQEFIQTNQMGQVMVPLSPKRPSIASTNGRGNSTFVQNTTIVQQQTTLVSNSHNAQMASNMPPARLSIDPNLLLGHKTSVPKKIFAEAESGEDKDDKVVLRGDGEGRGEGEYAKLMSEFVRHSVSTQTLAARKSPGAGAGGGGGGGGGAGGSPPDTTTHSPLGALEPARSPRRPPPKHYADTTTESPEPDDASSSAMVQCVSSSEQDMAESREHTWPTPRNDFGTDIETQNMMSNAPLMRQSRPHNPVESTELHYNQSMNAPAMNSQHIMPMAPNYYERTYANKQTYKRKNDFGDAHNFRNDKMMRTNYGMVHGLPKETDYDSMGMVSPDKGQSRQFPTSGPSSDNSAIQKVFDRHNLGSGDDGGSSGSRSRAFAVGDVVWGPVRGHASWPGTLEARAPAGRWRVRWFGGRAPAPVPAARLLTLSEGLEAHHAASTAHRKSRKLNTLLENAIQEAMAELDKKSERSVESQPEATNEETIADCETITETPKRSRKNDKVKTKEKVRKTSSKLAPTVTKSGESTRLRSSR